MIFVFLICSLSVLSCVLIFVFPAVKTKFHVLKRRRSVKKIITERIHKKVNRDISRDYSLYTISFSERVSYVILAAAGIAVISYMFFKSLIFTVILLPLALVYPYLKRKDLILSRKKKLTNQFKDLLYSLSSSLSAGKSLETAFYSAVTDLEMLYSDRETFILEELDIITRKLDMNDTITGALNDLALRAGIEDISSFSDVIAICSSTGGNLNEVVKNAADIISQKAEILNEIDVITTDQKMSQKILGIMPFVLLGIIQTSSPDYIKPLYSPSGHLVMFIVLVLLTTSFYIGARIADIKV